MQLKAAFFFPLFFFFKNNYKELAKRPRWDPETLHGRGLGNSHQNLGQGVLGLMRIQNREREEEEILKIFTFSERRERGKKNSKQNRNKPKRTACLWTNFRGKYGLENL